MIFGNRSLSVMRFKRILFLLFLHVQLNDLHIQSMPVPSSQYPSVVPIFIRFSLSRFVVLSSLIGRFKLLLHSN